MADNRKAYTRYLAYDRCLRNKGRKYIWSDLLEHANKALEEEGLRGVGKTQFYEDMKYMELALKAPIETYKEGKTSYFRYEDPNFSITNLPMNTTEANQIKSALSIMSRFKGPQFEWMNEIIPAVESKLGLITVEKEVIAFDSNVDYTGLQFLTPVFNGIVNRRVLKITYKDFNSMEPYEIIIHPYFLKQFNGRWFLLGFNEERKIPTWNMALDRMLSIAETSNAYIPDITNWEDYFYDIIGVTRIENETPQQIQLRFIPQTAQYILTKPLHGSQKKIKNDENGLVVSIEVIINPELESLILSFGERVKVIKPAAFKNRIKKKLADAIEQYN